MDGILLDGSSTNYCGFCFIVSPTWISDCILQGKSRMTLMGSIWFVFFEGQCRESSHVYYDQLFHFFQLRPDCRGVVIDMKSSLTARISESETLGLLLCMHAMPLSEFPEQRIVQCTGMHMERVLSCRTKVELPVT